MSFERTFKKAMEDATQGRTQQAIDSLRLAVRRGGDHPAVLGLLGTLLAQSGDFEPAIHFLNKAVAKAPKAGDLWANLGTAYFSCGRAADAVSALRRAVELVPANPAALHGLAAALLQTQNAGEALQWAERAAQVQPGWPEMDICRADALDVMDRQQRAFDVLEQARARFPDDLVVRSRQLHLLGYLPVTAEAARERLQDYARCVGPVPAFGEFDRNPDRPLRLGILSPDLRTHSVGYFVDAFTRHVPVDWHVSAFSAHPAGRDDQMARAFMERVGEWLPVHRMSDAGLDAAIRARKIDVLLELAGHSAGNRLTALNRRPAPLIVTAIGFAASTGHPAIDARVVDAITDPPGSEHWCTERLQRLDGCFLCYTPPAAAPAPQMPAADAPVTFGSFNLSGKVSAQTLALWKGALDAVPGSRLLLKARSLGDPSTRESLLERIRAAGIDEGRVELMAYVPGVDAHLALYRRVHVALDTTPYSGTTTTCEALWMGVPVVTLPGERHASRVSASLLQAAGFGELVAKDAADFARIAARCATDRAWGAEFRANARARMQASALMDSKAYAERFFGALRERWRVRCAQAG
jgi:protein O-GlcNAc transferase